MFLSPGAGSPISSEPVLGWSNGAGARGPGHTGDVKVAKTIKLSAVAIVLSTLMACNTASLSDIERAGIGAAVGCAVGEIIEDGECITGAAIGGVGGALSNDLGL